MRLERQLTIKEGLPLAIGSIVGSGILFLPSLIYAISRDNIFFVWVFMTFACLPLLEIFHDMVKHVPESNGIQGFVSLGLGPTIGATVPILFLGTVGIGMPTAAIIAGKYLCQFLGAPEAVAWGTAVSIMFVGVVSNLSGVKTSSLIQSVITVLLFLIGLAFILLNGKPILYALPLYVTTFQPELILSGMAMAMWAFAGFENLTFIAGEFKKPARDFRICAYLALFISGFLYLGLSLAYAASVKMGVAGSIASLYDLALNIHPQVLATVGIVLFALVCVQMNTNSWIWGISRLVYASASTGLLPNYLGTLNDKKIPVRAIHLLAILYGVVFIAYAIYPALLDKAILLGSTNFTFIYILTLCSYIRFKSKGPLKIVAYGLIGLLSIMVMRAGWLLVYPTALFGCALLYHQYQHLNLANVSSDLKRESIESNKESSKPINLDTGYEQG